MSQARTLSAAVALASGLLIGCASLPSAEVSEPPIVEGAERAAQGPSPFTTDGCSWFPDRSPSGRADWCHCCLVHDLAYWRGGTEGERAQADADLRRCVRETTGSAVWAALMFAGVRVAGGPWLHTSFRWGYGWPYGRGYTPVSAEEAPALTRLELDYRATNPTLQCAK